MSEQEHSTSKRCSVEQDEDGVYHFIFAFDRPAEFIKMRVRWIFPWRKPWQWPTWAYYHVKAWRMERKLNATR